MKYQLSSFSVSSITNRGDMCAEKGHSGTDSKGRCYCCGLVLLERVTAPDLETPAPAAASTPMIALPSNEVFELLGGPFDGEMVHSSAIVPSGRANLVTLGPRAALYVLDDAAGRGPSTPRTLSYLERR